MLWFDVFISLSFVGWCSVLVCYLNYSREVETKHTQARKKYTATESKKYVSKVSFQIDDNITSSIIIASTIRVEFFASSPSCFLCDLFYFIWAREQEYLICFDLSVAIDWTY